MADGTELPGVFSLLVSRKGLKASAAAIARLAKKHPEQECILTFGAGELRFNLVGGSVGVPAVGDWDGLVRVAGVAASELPRTMPAGDPIPFAVGDDGRLSIGNHFWTCATAPFRSVPVTVPVNATHADFIRIALTRTEVEIEASGLKQRVDHATAETKRNIQWAARYLEPYGVRRDEVESLVENAITRLRIELKKEAAL